MAFGKLPNARLIARNSTKYTKVVEPFGDNGTFAFENQKKKPKVHILNVVDDSLFRIFSFIQNITGADKKRLKSFDWISSQETFNKVLAMTAKDDVEFYYKFFYLKHFTKRVLDKEAPPTFDLLTVGQSASKILRVLPVQKSSLKNVTITSDEPFSVISKASGIDTFLILNPQTPEDKEKVKGLLSGLKINFFFMQKAKDSQLMFDDAPKFDKLSVSTFASATIMMATMEVITNYETSLDSITAISDGTKSMPPVGSKAVTGEPFALKQLAKKLRLEATVIPKFTELFMRISNTIRPTWDKTGILPDVSMFQDELESLLAGHYLRVSKAFHKDAVSELTKSYGISYETKEDIDDAIIESSDKTDAMLLLIMTARAKAQSAIILDTVQNDLNKAVEKTRQDAIKDGESLSKREQGKLVEESFTDKIESKSDRIAMTETQAIAEETKKAEAETLLLSEVAIGGVVVAVAMKKVWDSILDDRTRDSHSRANGQVRNMGEPFIVGGQMLKIPGDTSLGASLDNIINCRCSARYTLNP